jgi:hypothetical protein
MDALELARGCFVKWPDFFRECVCVCVCVHVSVDVGVLRVLTQVAECVTIDCQVTMKQKVYP